MEVAEHIEHAAHEGHEGHGDGHGDPQNKSLGKYVGLTMAVLGVLLAFASALTGGAKTNVIAAMVEQTDTSNRYQTVANKYRLIASQLEDLKAFMVTDPEAAKKVSDDLDKLEKASAHSPNATTLHFVRMEFEDLKNAVIPATDDIVHLAKQTRAYKTEREAVKEWAESYDDKIEAYQESAEHFEMAQLAAEIGVVIASIALLLHNRAAWMISMGLGVISLSVVALTYVGTNAKLSSAQKKIDESKKHYELMNQDEKDDEEDEAMIKDVLAQSGVPDAAGMHADEGKDGDATPAPSAKPADTAVPKHDGKDEKKKHSG